ncbi:MAG: sugar transferase [Candidatus Zixiibacteriota bacterium]|nr:MAG: sugar transferase [candidate division Zixibacteria bacterium]
MNKLTKKILLLFSGSSGSFIISLIILYCSVAVTGKLDSHIYEMLIALFIIRAGFAIYSPPRPVFKTLVNRQKIKNVIINETLISLLFLSACYLMQWPVSRFSIGLFVLCNFLLQFSLSQLNNFVIKLLAKTQTPENHVYSKQVIIVGTGKKAKEIASLILDSPELDSLLIGFLDYQKKGLWRFRDIPLIGHPDEFEKIASQCHINSLIIATDPDELHKTQRLFEVSEKMGVPLCLMPDFFESKITKPNQAQLNGFPAIVYSAVPQVKLPLLIKTVIDKIGALIGILITSPIIIFSAIAIKFNSKGPVLFKQVRTGLNGQRFEFYKFRTMCNDAEQKKTQLTQLNEMSGPVFKIKDDPRVTSVGRVLRKYSIDELPQFFNILRGDMSLVGPRPPLPSEVIHYEPWQHRKLSVKPGITCIWQVNGRNAIDFEDWMRLDLQYIDNWSLWLDTKLILQTIPAVMKSRGAS